MAIRIQPRVLIVEDDVQARRILATVVGFHNYKVLQAGNGIEALAVLRTETPHVVISDLQMPRMDGYAFLRLIAGYFPKTGSIALSGAFDHACETLRSVVADAFFAKGAYSTQSLLNCVDDLAALFPLHAVWKPSTLSVAWIPQDKPAFVWLACRKCLHCFPTAETISFPSGIHEACCPSCSAHLDFLVEQPRREPATAA